MAKRLHKKKSSLIRIGEQAPKELRQHKNLIFEVVDRDAHNRVIIKRQRNLDECRLDTYFHRSWISEDEREAGVKFRGAYLRAVFNVRVSDDVTNRFLNEAGGGNSEAAVLARIASEELLRKIYKILSASQRAIVISVCGHDEFAGTVAKRKTLVRALDKMARHWGII